MLRLMDEDKDMQIMVKESMLRVAQEEVSINKKLTTKYLMQKWLKT